MEHPGDAAAASGSSSEGGARPGPAWIPVTLLVLAVIVGGGTTVDAVLIGHSGATAVWSDDM
ncbi:hypothetical protein AAIB33_09555 [Microbacterium sp. AZCO]|uniref:hypothetical protein n=1 Tax=Microbacterium sp. AZCO TaxID=3142976 RepID=UPI0031F34279